MVGMHRTAGAYAFAGVFLFVVVPAHFANAQVPAYTISTAAGTGGCCSGGQNFPAQASSVVFGLLSAMTYDRSGNLLIAENTLLLQMSPSGVITKIAGGGPTSPTLGDGGPATSASIEIDGIAVDAVGNIYVADYLTTVSVRFRLMARSTRSQAPVPRRAFPVITGPRRAQRLRARMM